MKEPHLSPPLTIPYRSRVLKPQGESGVGRRDEVGVGGRGWGAVLERERIGERGACDTVHCGSQSHYVFMEPELWQAFASGRCFLSRMARLGGRLGMSPVI